MPKDKDSNLFFSSIIENIPDMIFIKEAKELRFVHFNKAGQELLGSKSEDLVGKNDYDFFPKSEADFFTAKDRQVLESGKILDIAEEPIHTKNHGLRWLHTKKIPLLDEKGKPLYLLGISRDVTELKLAREKLVSLIDELEMRVEERTNHLQKANMELARLSHVTSEFATMVTHELRTPLSVVKEGVSQILDGLDGSINDGQRETLEVVKNNTERLARLIQNVLEFQKMDSGLQAPVMKPQDLEKLFGQVVSSMQKLAERKNVKISLKQPADKVPPFMCDGDKIQQLLVNIIDNALKFTFEGGEVSVAYDLSPKQLEMVISDNGIGIKSGDRETIFKMFSQGRTAEAWRAGGHGVGLAVCKKIIEMHRGEIKVESVQDQGTKFTVTIPTGLKSDQP